MHKPADRIRNVALVSHHGVGKTSLAEAMQAVGQGKPAQVAQIKELGDGRALRCGCLDRPLVALPDLVDPERMGRNPGNDFHVLGLHRP